MLENTVLISFAGSDVHRIFQDRLHLTYGSNFYDNVRYDLAWLKFSGLYEKYKHIFSYKKYCGYFLWKPFIIEHALQHNPGKDILYLDTNIEITDFDRFESLYKYQMREQNMFLIQHWNRVNKDYTKYDTFHIMEGLAPSIVNAYQVWTSVVGWGRFNSNLLIDYKNYCLNENALTELPNVYGENLDGYVAHRWEQSILSILVAKRGIKCVSDQITSTFINKEYSQDLIRLKEEVDKDPLGKVE